MGEVDKEQTGRIQSPNEEDEITYPYRAYVYTDASWGDKIGTWAVVVQTRNEENLLSLTPIMEYGLVPPPYDTGSGNCELYAIHKGIEIVLGLDGIKVIDLYTDAINFEKCLKEYDPAFSSSKPRLYPAIREALKNIKLYVHYTNSDHVCVNEMMHKQAHVMASNKRRIELRERKCLVYLDDERTAPGGWVQVRWPEEAIDLLKTGNVETISLDHDLGEGSEYENPRTGYDVLLWIEKEVATGDFTPPKIIIHTANTPARSKMNLAVRQIKRLYKRREAGV